MKLCRTSSSSSTTALLTLVATLVTTISSWPCSVSASSSHDPTRRHIIPRSPNPEERKYFHEPGHDDVTGHYDSRFFRNVVTDFERTETLIAGIKAYLTFFREQGLETWIAHGTLLGWWWNGKMFPWDWDVDVQVNGATLAYMADHLNHSRYAYTSDDGAVTREFLLDVNPYSKRRQHGAGLNIIDARWIDTHNGLYVDITGLSELDPEGEPGALSCKNAHKYNITDLYPMRESTYHGVPAKIPFRYHDLLVKEYGENALAQRSFEGHYWNEEMQEWVPDPERMAETARHKKEEQEKKEAEENEKQQREAE